MKRRTVFAALGGLSLLAALFVGSALAVHDEGLFELDVVNGQAAANTWDDPSVPGEDWADVYAKSLDASRPLNAFAFAFITDGVGQQEASFFTGGGSKDVNDIPDWLYATVNDVVPDKDDIEHAFAAAYEKAEADGTHTIFYFGGDRFDAGDGSAQLGFWFFRQPVTLNPLVPPATTGTFNGVHQVGDILVLADFVKGGGVGALSVYQWVGGKSNPVQLIGTRASADCAIAPANDSVCAVLNKIGGETPPWPYLNKDGQTAYQAFALFEGGIDLTELLQVQDIGCFSSFLAETRSSGSSLTAQLKDFALGAFPVCGLRVTKTASPLSKVGDDVTYTITIENTGRATLYKRNVSDSLLGAIAVNGVDQANGAVLSSTCGASLARTGAPGSSCTITLVRTVQPGDPDPLVNTASVLYAEKADFTGLAFSGDARATTNLFQPAVLLEKSGDTLSKVGDWVNYTFTITNKSSADSPDLELVSLVDDVLGDLGPLAVAAGCDVLSKDEICTFTAVREVQPTDPDPLKNTAVVHYHPAGFPNDITWSDSHNVNLFQPSVAVAKTGNALSKLGDAVTYHVAISNTSSLDSPALALDSVSDDVLGDLSAAAIAAGCGSLAPGASCGFDVPWTVAAVDVNPVDGVADDPVINTVQVHFHPIGFPNDVQATGSHKLNLFQPSIAFDETHSTELSKIGDSITYTLTLNDTSSADSPDLTCTIADVLLGVSKTVTLAAGQGDVTTVVYTVKAGDPDPLLNQASVTCSPAGFPNVLDASDSSSVNLFQPSIAVSKTGDALSKIGDDVTYTFTITNTSSADSPVLKLAKASDDVLGDLLAAATAATPTSCDNLAPGASCTFDVKWTVAAVDLYTQDAQGSTPGADGKPDDPVINTFEVLYHPVGFPNDIGGATTHSLNLFQPSMEFTKGADTRLSKVGDVVHYVLTLRNTSSSDSPDLVCSIVDPIIGVSESRTLASGTEVTIPVAWVVQSTDADPLVNVAKATCSPAGFPNVLERTGRWTVELFQPRVGITKTHAPAASKAGDDVYYTFTVQNLGSPDSPPLVLDSIGDDVLGDLASLATAGGCGQIQTSCTFTAKYTVKDTDPDPLVNTVTVHTHPLGFTNDIWTTASDSLDLFQPRISLAKTGAALSKIGDPVTYRITLANGSSADTPDLTCTVTDPKAGVNETFGIASGGSKTIEVANFIIPAGASDPFVNDAHAHCWFPETYPNVYDADASWSTNLFQPGVAIQKSGPPLSKFGDGVSYHFQITNTGSADAPDLVLDSLVDDVLGNLAAHAPAACGRLAPGASCSFDVPWTVAPVDVNPRDGQPDDPVVNTVTVHTHPDGFPNDVHASASHSLNLFQPRIELSKSGADLSKRGDLVSYVITLTNYSSSDTPPMTCTVTDAPVGVSETFTIAAGSPANPTTHAVPVTGFQIPLDAPDPYVNDADVRCTFQDFPNVLTGHASWSTNLFQPEIDLAKTGAALSKIGDPVSYTITFTNKSSSDTPPMLCTLTDPDVGVNEQFTSLAGSLPHVVQVNDFKIPQGASDPFVNHASVTCHFADFPNVLSKEAEWSTNLFQVTVGAGAAAAGDAGTALSKIGDTVTYTFTVKNSSSADAPDLVCTLEAKARDGGQVVLAQQSFTLPSGGSPHVVTQPFQIPAGASDPFSVDVTGSCSPQGFPNVYALDASVSVNLFQPSFVFQKTAEPLSKAGDDLHYVLTLENTSSQDSPDLVCTIADPMLGVLQTGVTLGYQGVHAIPVTYTVKGGDPDPLVNVATASCSPSGFPNVISASASWPVNLFQPSMKLTKSGPAYSKVGDTATFHVTIENTSSGDAPAMQLLSFSDSLAGNVTPPDECKSLASGASCGFDYSYTVQAGDDTGLPGATLVNTATAVYQPLGFPNRIPAAGSWPTTLLHPNNFSASKVCSAVEPVPQEGPAKFRITFLNSSDTDLRVAPSEGDAFDVAAGQSHSYEVAVNGPFTGQQTVTNTVTGTVTLDPRYQLGNAYDFGASGECRVGGRANVEKTTLIRGTLYPNAIWTFQIFAGGHAADATSGFLGSPLVSDTTPPELLDFGNYNLDPAKTYAICERNVPAGYTVTWRYDYDGDGVIDAGEILNPYNPNAKDSPSADVGNRCVDVGAGTPFPIPAGGTLRFAVENNFPGGQPRTIGYWKNWSTCTGGNQVQTAAKNGGPANGWYTLDDLLRNPGFTIGLMVVNGTWDDDPYPFPNAPYGGDCVEAVRILDKSDAKTGKKLANDAAYELASQYFAASLNVAAQASACTDARSAILSGQSLLAGVSFTGAGSYLPSSTSNQTLRATFLATAKTLDKYNNGILCPTP